MARNLATLVRDLQRRRGRERRGLVVAEGFRLVSEVLDTGAPVVGVIAVEHAAEALVAAARQKGIDTALVPEREFRGLADTDTPSGVLAVVEWSPLALSDLAAPDIGRRRLLVLDGIQDPGNVGAMIRSAHALGAFATVALDGTADVRNPKAVRGSMGSLFRHQVATAAWREFVDWGKREGYEFWLATPKAEAVGAAAAGPRVALVVGSEGHGLREEWAATPRRLVGIPMLQGAESLNAAVAAGIMLYELSRDRR
jgi:TrmH family RNA methyltransferase